MALLVMMYPIFMVGYRILQELDIAIVKATNHVERPAKEKYIRGRFFLKMVACCTTFDLHLEERIGQSELMLSLYLVFFLKLFSLLFLQQDLGLMLHIASMVLLGG